MCILYTSVVCMSIRNINCGAVGDSKGYFESNKSHFGTSLAYVSLEAIMVSPLRKSNRISFMGSHDHLGSLAPLTFRYIILHIYIQARCSNNMVCSTV